MNLHTIAIKIPRLLLLHISLVSTCATNNRNKENQTDILVFFYFLIWSRLTFPKVIMWKHEFVVRFAGDGRIVSICLTKYRQQHCWGEKMFQKKRKENKTDGLLVGRIVECATNTNKISEMQIFEGKTVFQYADDHLFQTLWSAEESVVDVSLFA